MRESCFVYCFSGIQSLFEVVLLYTFHTFGAETRESKTGILSLSGTSSIKLLRMRGGSKHVGDMSDKKKLKNLRTFRDDHRKFVQKTIADVKGLITEGIPLK